MAVIGLTVGLIAGASGIAVAFFTSSGSGNGSAQTGTAANVTISQVGAGYDSLAPTYHQDQCFECSSLTEFGNEINLAAGSGQLGNVVVAFRSYAGGTTSEPITLTLYNPGAAPSYVGSEVTPYSSVTTDPTIPAGDGSTVFYATFDFSSLGLTLSGPVVYGISFTDEPGVTINVALSNSVSNLTVGSDVYPGDVFVDGTDANALSASSDAGSCSTSTAGVFMATDINCATPGVNYGAYGPGSNPNNADIPAVEFNVVGGSTPPLFPGSSEPVDFAITNAGSSPANITTVTTNLVSVGSGSIVGDSTCVIGEYSLTNAVNTLDVTVPTGTTFFSPSGTAITMTNETYNQDNCEGQAVTLGFTSP
jgi:hypothetical protein